MVEIIIIECYFDIMCGMDFSEMIRQRYSVRKYDSRPVEEEQTPILRKEHRMDGSMNP